MKKIIGIILWLVSVQTIASNNVGCAKVGASMYIDLTDAIIKDLKISPNQIIRNNVTVEVLSVLPISKFYAEKLADYDYKHQPLDVLSKDDYVEGYTTKDVKIVVAKYTYRNIKNQKNIFIASSLKNNNECSLRFNGYMIVDREF
ncbi:Shiga toxin A subunit [Rosenbergiella australiborealis]|uniref:Shiga toxin A subunit n=1 Tax=Rosenbergiella australiborealis TaxID=1544696 RepID=A0ABS5T4K6_9GAMM|nr:Shiga toxin A subunit [Rosenbergiella australiborealis]MBT0725923.1 Shiga toxin A subunit [Rosenbergiella australiborealis]